MSQLPDAELSPAAELMLLILVANGGEMDKADAAREFTRVLALSDSEHALWRARVLSLVRQHARWVLDGGEL